MARPVSRLAVIAALVAPGALILVPGCESASLPAKLRPNSGSTLTTQAGQQLTEEMFIGKWDLDGERTNAVNGDAGVLSIPSDIMKDLFGRGWRFQTGGVLLTDKTFGPKRGRWSLEGRNTLVIQEAGRLVKIRYKVGFKDGFMYLKRPNGSWFVFERDKFFGL